MHLFLCFFLFFVSFNSYAASKPRNFVVRAPADVSAKSKDFECDHLSSSDISKPCISWGRWRPMTKGFIGACKNVGRQKCEAAILIRYGEMKNYPYIKSNSPLSAKTAIQFGYFLGEVDYWDRPMPDKKPLQIGIAINETKSVYAQKVNLQTCSFLKHVVAPVVLTGLVVGTTGGLGLSSLIPILSGAGTALTAVRFAADAVIGTWTLAETTAYAQAVKQANTADTVQKLFEAFGDEEKLQRMMYHKVTNSNVFNAADEDAAATTEIGSPAQTIASSDDGKDEEIDGDVSLKPEVKRRYLIDFELLVPEYKRALGLEVAMSKIFVTEITAMEACNRSIYDPDAPIIKTIR